MKINMMGRWSHNAGYAIVASQGGISVKIIARGNGQYASEQQPANISEAQATMIAKEAIEKISTDNYHMGIMLNAGGQVLNINPLTTKCIAVQI